VIVLSTNNTNNKKNTNNKTQHKNTTNNKGNAQAKNGNVAKNKQAVATTTPQKQAPKKVVQKKEKAIDHKCPGCRAPIFFVPNLGKWKCEYCNGEYTLEALQQFNNASSIEQNKDVHLSENTADLYTSYKCKNCGAEIVADTQTSATFCVYCGNTAILKSKLSGQFKPDLIIPFKKEKQVAINAFKNLSNGRPFLPDDFNDEKNIEKIRGIYIPFWIYDMLVMGGMEARGQKVTSWSRGDTRYTKTDYYKIYRDGSIRFNKIPVDGSSRFDNDIMSSIEPFNYKELVPYNHAYLSGFLAERYDIEGDTLVGDAVSRAVESTKSTFLNDASGYSSKSIFSTTLAPYDVKKQYALFPVWMVNVKYKDKYYLFAMNGQTGEFVGNMPIDKKKVWFYGIKMFLGIFLGLLALLFVLFKLGVWF
jgi:DNA-directed RNA polymerase subunit RPC12/RpoP